MGMTNMLIMGIGGMLFQPLIGVLAHTRGGEIPGATAALKARSSSPRSQR